MRTLITLLGALSMLIAVRSSAAVTIGAEAVIGLPGVSTNSMWVGWRPSSGSTQTVNPPVFTWNYQLIETTGAQDYLVRKFMLEISFTNFGALAFSKYTDINFFNGIPPLTNGTSPVYWRVKSYTNEVLEKTSAVRQYTMTNAPIYWNRTKLDDDSYLTNKTHPYMLLTTNNRSAVDTWLRANKESHYLYRRTAATNLYTTLVGYGYTNGAITADTRNTWAYGLLQIAFMWQLTRDTYWATNSGMPTAAAFDHFVNYFITNKVWSEDYYATDESWAVMGFGYDYLYDLMSTPQRSNAVHAIELGWMAMRTNVWWDMPITPGSHTVMDWGSAMKKGAAHPMVVHQYTMLGMLSAMTENTNILAGWKRTANWMNSKAYVYSVLGGSSQGRDYAQAGQAYTRNTYLPTFLYCQNIWPEIGWTNSPWIRDTANWWSYNNTVGHDRYLEQWGDTGAGAFVLMGKHSVGRVLAQLTMNGDITGHFLNQSNYNKARYVGTSNENPWNNADFLETLIQEYLFPLAPRTTNAPKAHLMAADGVVISASGPPSVESTLTNGTWMMTLARPAGTEANHSYFNDGSFELLAYGANLTYAGNGLIGPGRPTWLHYCPLPKGLGQWSNQQVMDYDWVSRIIAFTNSADYVLTATDTTRAYIFDEYTGGQSTPPSYALANAPVDGHGQNEQLSCVKRIMLHMAQKYWVIYDTIKTDGTTNITTLFPYRIQGTNTNYVATSHGSFSYSRTNLQGSSITTHVFAVATNNLSFTVATGTNVLTNPITGENQWVSTYLDGLPQAGNVVWWQNATPSTNQTFLTVIYPDKPGDAAATLTRIDEGTVRVQSPGLDQTITFNGYSGADYAVDVPAILGESAGSTPEPPPAPESSTGAKSSIKRVIIRRGIMR